MRRRDAAPIAPDNFSLFSFSLIGYGLIFLISYLFVLAHTLLYPYPLEVYEGSNLAEAAYLLHTGDIYTAPAFQHMPLIYTPFYYYITAPFIALFGDTLAAGRLVSLLATLAVICILYRWLRREHFSRAWAWAGCMTPLAMYYALGQWYHTVHVDMLMTALLLAGCYVLHFGTGRQSALVAGVLLALSVFTKQQAMLLILPFGCAVALRNWRRAGVAAAAAIAVLAVLCGFETWRSHGWFIYYTLELPGSMPTDAINLFLSLFYDCLLFAPILVGFAGYFLLRHAAADYRGLALGGVLCGALARLHEGSWVNVLIPMWMVLILPACLGLRAAIHHHPRDAWVLRLLAGVQAALFLYSPLQAIPSATYTQAVERLDHFVEAQKGTVLMDTDLHIPQPHLQYYLALGEGIFYSRSYVKPDVKKDFAALLSQAVTQQHFDSIITAVPLNNWPQLSAFYVLDRRLSAHVHYPVGLFVLPSYVYKAKHDSAATEQETP